MKKISVRSTLLVFFIFLALIYASEILADWYDPNWSSRKLVIIDNTQNNDTLYDFQIEVFVLFCTEMQNDFDDIRFTTDDEVTSISYWIEEFVTSNYAIVWVKVPMIPALDTTIIYLYYGNPSATSESNGEEVFDFLMISMTRI